jgi:hypothetical protein
MDPLNVVQWTAEYGDARSIVVPASAPEPTPFNADLSAKAFLDHVQGTTLLAANMLTKGVLMRRRLPGLCFASADC